MKKTLLFICLALTSVLAGCATNNPNQYSNEGVSSSTIGAASASEESGSVSVVGSQIAIDYSSPVSVVRAYYQDNLAHFIELVVADSLHAQVRQAFGRYYTDKTKQCLINITYHPTPDIQGEESEFFLKCGLKDNGYFQASPPIGDLEIFETDRSKNDAHVSLRLKPSLYKEYQIPNEPLPEQENSFVYHLVLERNSWKIDSSDDGNTSYIYNP